MHPTLNVIGMPAAKKARDSACLSLTLLAPLLAGGGLCAAGEAPPLPEPSLGASCVALSALRLSSIGYSALEAALAAMRSYAGLASRSTCRGASCGAKARYLCTGRHLVQINMCNGGFLTPYFTLAGGSGLFDPQLVARSSQPAHHLDRPHLAAADLLGAQRLKGSVGDPHPPSQLPAGHNAAGPRLS